MRKSLVLNHMSLSDVYKTWDGSYLTTFLCWAEYHGSLDALPWCLHHNTPQSPHEKELQVSCELAMTPCVWSNPPCQLCPSNATNFWVSIDCWVGLSTTGKHKGNMDGKSLRQVWNRPCWTANARTLRDRQGKNPRHREAADTKKSCSSQRGSHSGQALANTERGESLTNSVRSLFRNTSLATLRAG